MRFAVYPDRPLWLDEVWTGMIVSQPTLAGFIHQCSIDVNGPLYSILAALCAPVLGISDHGLRVLPCAFGIVAPLVALTPQRSIDWPTRAVWSALLACWIPGLLFSQEARPYTLTLALGVANTIAFAGLMDAPGRRAAWAWAIISALFVLSHYFVALIVSVQLLAFVAIFRKRAVATWPALLAFSPVLAALSMQADGLAHFSTKATSWIRLLDWTGVYSDIAFLFGLPVLALTTILWFAATIVLRRPSTADQPRVATGPWLAAGCAVGSALAALGIGFIRPVLVDRYLTGYAPGVLLSLALAATRYGRGWAISAPALVAPFAVMAGVWAASPHPTENRFSWEKAASALMAWRVDRLVFLWDTPLGGERTSIQGVGGFFFARSGRAIPVDPVILTSGQDPNPVIVARARPPGSGVLWIYDRMITGTAALEHPPRLGSYHSGLRCQDFGDKRFGILACRQTRPNEHPS
jgi:hypothetical protein